MRREEAFPILSGLVIFLGCILAIVYLCIAAYGATSILACALQAFAAACVVWITFLALERGWHSA